MTITDLQRHAEGYWVARVSDEYTSFSVDRKAGSWQIVIPAEGGEYRKDVLPHVARALQARLPASERGGRRGSVALTADGARYGSVRS
jgi:hypothetical protein